MPKNDLLKLIYDDLQELRSEIKEVRQTDIPSLRTMSATLRTEINHVKEKASTRSMIVSGVGGLIAIATSVAVAYFK